MMKPSRRSFLQTAAALPAAGLISMSPAVAAAATIPATVAAPTYPFQWWFSYDGGEMYTEEFNTKEQALAFLKSEGEGMIAECCRQDYDLSIDGYDIIELLQNQNEEAIGEGEFFDCNSEQERDLGQMVSAAIEEWARKHKIDIAAWTFGEVRNKIKAEEVKPPAHTERAGES